MKYDLKNPALAGSKVRVFLFISLILFGIMPVFTGWLQEIEANATPKDILTDHSKNLVFVQGNTLTSISRTAYSALKTKQISVIVTAYSSTVAQTDEDPFVTAAGTWVRDGIVANNKLPFGTKITIPEIYGDKIFTVEDRMNRRKSDNHFDVWFPSYWDALDFGAKKTYIEIIEN